MSAKWKWELIYKAKKEEKDESEQPVQKMNVRHICLTFTKNINYSLRLLRFCARCGIAFCLSFFIYMPAVEI